MPSLADLFNPTFLMFLGILVLVAALLVVYFESKIRDQNHKISSMLSLVSTLAEDMNGIKMGLNHLAIRSSQINNNLGNTQIISNVNNDLIEVSDDGENDDEEEYEDEYENEDEEENISVEDSENNDSEYDDYENDTDNVKVLKLTISQNESESGNNSDLDEMADLDGEFEPVDEVPEMADEYIEEVLDLKYDEPNINELKVEEPKESVISSSDFKTISINLGESAEDQIDYKKLQLPKLKSIVTEKGLATSTEASKLKKQELLKLLGVE